MVSSLFVYAIIVELINRTGTINDAMVTAPQAIRWVIYAAAVSMVFVIPVVKGLMLRGFSPRGEDEVLERLASASVLAGALAEVPAICGLVLFFLNRAYYADFYILGLISLYLLLRHYPRFGQWECVIGVCTADAP